MDRRGTHYPFQAKRASPNKTAPSNPVGGFAAASELCKRGYEAAPTSEHDPIGARTLAHLAAMLVAVRCRQLRLIIGIVLLAGQYSPQQIAPAVIELAGTRATL